ncbi:uncharacterized SDCCAG3 family protein isoform X1 [Durio zibethinus]|uniref:Uncharacterized SDCCAG3 family protein isoform X1 n=1 Tax=Durio zibethinus TaxID=66656 RepID=A0A6P5YSL1_DURZI|nr:uncharacterized SDCCAG3 family protein isoform X1 [Durio zibethinus]
MEETKSPTTTPRRRTSKRKPFTDLSNTVPSSLPSSQSSSSSLLKPPTKSSLSLPLKSLLNNNLNTDLNSNSKFTATQFTANKNNHNDKKREKKKGPINRANPSSMLSPPPKTPSVSGIGDCVDFEPCTVYNRRHTAEKRKSKGKEIAEPFSCFFEMRMPDLREKKDGDGDIGLSKSCPIARKKKQHREKSEVNAAKHDLPQDFIDRQRAYFAEVDAFELEEEVASADELE